MLTVREAMLLPSLAGATVIAGEAGLEKSISSVTAVDVPDFTAWLRGREFVLMTGYAFRDQEESLARVIASLAQAGVSALGIKFKRYIASLPQEAREIADKVGLPIIAIPYECAWIDVINPIMTEIINQQARQLERSDQIRRLLLEQIFNRGGLPGIAPLLAEFVGNPVTLIDLSGQNVIHSEGSDWQPSSQINSFSGHWTPGEGEVLHHLQSLPLVMQISGNERARVVIPVDAARITTGYIVVWESNRPFRSADLIPLEQGLMVVALEIEQLEAVRKANRHLRHDFLRRLLEGEPPNYFSARLLAGEVGWTLGERYVVAILDVAPEGKAGVRGSSPAPDRGAWGIKEHLLRHAPHVLGAQVLFGLDGKQRLVMLWPVEEGQQEGLSGDGLTAFLKRPLDRLGGLAREEQGYLLNVGVGRYYPGYEGISRAYREAVEAFEIGPQIHGPGTRTCYADLGIYRLLSHRALADEMEAFFAETIGPLLDSDHASGGALLQTLTVFLETGGNHRETAKRLYLHHNTVRYRMKSIERLCDVNLKREHDRLNLTIGLKLMPLLAPHWAQGTKRGPDLGTGGQR